MMENDPNRKESKTKRIFKKALRRNSKSSNNDQNSVLEQNISVTRSKSTESGQQGIEINDSTPLHKPDCIAEPVNSAGQRTKIELPNSQAPANQSKEFQKVDTSGRKESTASKNGNKVKFSKLQINDQRSLDGSKNKLKRKFEEESAAGTSGASAGTSDTDADDKDPSKDKKKKNRCAVCRKKVGLTGFECRCGGLFCAVHRYSDKHECSFDYRELGAQEIRRNNPVVVSQKIHKI